MSRKHSLKQRATLLGVLALMASQSRAFVSQKSTCTSRRIPSSSALFASLSTPPSSSFSTSQQTTRHNSKNSNNNNTPLDRQIVALGRKGQVDAALKLFFSIPSPTLRQVNAAIDACGRSQQVRLDQAMDIFNKYCPSQKQQKQQSSSSSKSPSSSLQANVYTFGALMTVCARARDVQQAMQLLEKMPTDYNIRPNGVVYNAAISACANAVRPDLAMQLLEQAREHKVELSVVGYNAAISAAAKAGQWEMALELIEQMKSGSYYLSPQPDAVSYGTLLAACERGNQWRLLIEQAEIMKQQGGFQWDGLAYTSVLHACQQLGWWQQALEYLQEMKTVDSYQRRTAGFHVAGNRKPLQGPDAVAYRLVISACARGGAWQEGIKVLNEYCKQFDGGDVVAYTAAISGCQYEGKWVQAFLLLNRMRQTNVEPNAVTFAAVIHACATATSKLVSTEPSTIDAPTDSFPESHIKAMRLLNVLKTDPTVPDPTIQIYNAAIRSCAEALDTDRAFEIVEELRNSATEPNIITYGALMTACERKGNTDLASKVFHMMYEDDVKPNEIIYGAAISCCRKARDPERAFSLLNNMIRDSLEPNAAVFNTVLMAQIESAAQSEESKERAMTVFKILKSPEYTAASPDRRTYNILIRYMASNKNPREAESLLEQMQEDGFVPDVDLFTATIASYEKTRRPLKALRLMESMRANGYDFYESPVLNSAFKKAVSLANAVGQNLASDEED